VFNRTTYRDKKVVGVFVRFRAPYFIWRRNVVILLSIVMVVIVLRGAVPARAVT
jgi:hypothetical protein